MSSSSNEGGDVPFHMMPVAAVFGTYALVSSIKATYQAYKSLTFKPTRPTAIPPTPIKSKKFFFLLLSCLASMLAYGYISAQVNNAIATSDYQHFDPYDILSIDSSSNSTIIKSAYRSLSKIHHPDKTSGDDKAFHRIHQAYKTLTDETSKHNFEKYGHPDGPLQTQTLNFALPSWLLHPTGNVAITLVVLYLSLFLFLIYVVVDYVKSTEKKASDRAFEMSVAGGDMAYLANHLRPASTHVEILFYLATTPECLEMAERMIERADEMREKRVAFLKGDGKKVKDDEVRDAFDISGDDGWAEDDEEEDDDGKDAAKKAQEEKERLKKEVDAASGKANLIENIRIEGLDEGVLGQEWVETTLGKIGQWPPPFLKEKGLDQMTFAQSVKGGEKVVVDVLAHRAARRNLCMIMGRVNSQFLNTHSELVNAGKKQLIDGTYFQSTLEFRQKMGLLLEAGLRIAGSTKCHRLYATIVETAAMFKIGIQSVSDEKTVSWFNRNMTDMYGEKGIPKLNIKEKVLETPDEDEVQAGDLMSLSLKIERAHAESFTKQKINAAMQQGVPPQIALATYREVWWVLIRAKRIDGGNDGAIELSEEKSSVLKDMDSGAKQAFESEKPEDRLLTAWPTMVSNVAQVSGDAKVRFKAPDVPGKYEFTIDVKSQDFLTCDQSFTMEKEIVEKKEIEINDDEEEEEEELKKTK